jgi:hypothetical protein
VKVKFGQSAIVSSTERLVQSEGGNFAAFGSGQNLKIRKKAVLNWKNMLPPTSILLLITMNHLFELGI